MKITDILRSYHIYSEFSDSLSDNQKRLLKEASKEMGWSCNAHSEGMLCCIDYILKED